VVSLSIGRLVESIRRCQSVHVIVTALGDVQVLLVWS